MNIMGFRAGPRPTSTDPIARRARHGVFGFFFLNGFVMGMWAAGLPALNDRLGLGPSRLGSVLLLVSGGALLSMLIAGRLVDRWSSRRICWYAGPVSAVALLGPALAGTYGVLAVFAVLFGLGIGLIEVSMNTHSVEVEQRYGRPIISAFHGVWSLGGATGGALTAAGLKAGVGGEVLLTAVALVVPLAFVPAARRLLPPAPPPGPQAAGGVAVGDRAVGEQTAGGKAVADKPGSEEPGSEEPAGKSGGGAVTAKTRPAVPFRWGLVVLLGVAAFAGHLSEGAAMDWAALHTRWVLEADPALAPLAYTIFAVAMTTVRLLGDPIRARLGPVRTIRLAGMHATGGYLLVLAAPLAGESLRLVVAWTGWALVGIGLATVVPVIFSAVGASGSAMGRALALVAASGYTGMLLGPAVLGYVAEHASLPVALIIPAVTAAVITLVGTPAIRSLTGGRASDDDEVARAEAEAGAEAPAPSRTGAG